MVQPPKALSYGTVGKPDFKSSIQFEETNGLFLIPVKIKGKEYKFLFDTGAPFSISKEIQANLQFKKVSQGKIVDSDNNRSKVDYVSVDTVWIGEVAFLKQTAFVASFKDNPVLKCFGIDGIIGSNLMKDAQWQIMPTKNEMIISSEIDQGFIENADTLHFGSDFQYDISLPITIGDLKFYEAKLDYGSNGGISLSKHHFHQLENHHLLKNASSLIGMNQSGILGQIVENNKQISISDSLMIGNTGVKATKIQIGGKDLIGTQVLSKLDLAIDWKNKRLYFKRNEKEDKEYKTFGFYVGSEAEKKVMVLAIMEGSSAYEKELKAGMTILEVNGVDLSKENAFCEYLDILEMKPDKMDLTLKTEEGKRIEINLELSKLKPTRNAE